MGVTKPKWVGGFDTEEAAKAARDEARVRARRGEYVNGSTSTVADHLAEWVEAHAATVKPKTLAGYRHDIDHYIVPRIGRMRPLEATGSSVEPPRTGPAGHQPRQNPMTYGNESRLTQEPVLVHIADYLRISG